MPQAEIGIIGGSTLYGLEELADAGEVTVETPYGAPSDAIVTGKLDGVPLAFLPRHGKGHPLSPSDIPARANIWALKSLGVKRVIAVCTCGSFKEELAPGHLLIPDQLIDKTTLRQNTFFGDGVVAHVPFADPFCGDLRAVLLAAAREAGATVHPEGNYVCMEGPTFSTRAESRLHRSWGADVIGMTALPEAKLAREAELCYAAICFVTDYDVWHEEEADVSADLILKNLLHNVESGRAIISATVAALPQQRDCDCGDALASALVTAPNFVPAETRQRLDLLLRRYRGPADGGGS